MVVVEGVCVQIVLQDYCPDNDSSWNVLPTFLALLAITDITVIDTFLTLGLKVKRDSIVLAFHAFVSI